MSEGSTLAVKQRAMCFPPNRNCEWRSSGQWGRIRRYAFWFSILQAWTPKRECISWMRVVCKLEDTLSSLSKLCSPISHPLNNPLLPYVHFIFLKDIIFWYSQTGWRYYTEIKGIPELEIFFFFLYLLLTPWRQVRLSEESWVLSFTDRSH